MKITTSVSALALKFLLLSLITSQLLLIGQRGKERKGVTASRQYFASAPWAGHIAYFADVPVHGPPQPQIADLVYRDLSQLHKTTSRRVKPPMAQILFAPTHSQSGSFLAFGVGWPYDLGSTFQIKIVDDKTGVIVPGPPLDLSNPVFCWSPDGRQLAFVSGGDNEGIPSATMPPLRLHLWNRITKADRVVAEGFGVTSYSWTQGGDLLYCAYPPQKPGEAFPLGPRIYQTSPNGRVRELARDGYEPSDYQQMPEPAASPDGRWIAFFGWSIFRKLEKTPEGKRPVRRPLLRLLDRQRNLQSDIPLPPSGRLCWTPDSRRLIVMLAQYAQAKTGYTGTAQFSAVDPVTRGVMPLASVTAHDEIAGDRPLTSPQFQIKGFSRDGRHMVIQEDEIGGLVDSSPDSARHGHLSLVAVDVLTGRSVRLCRLVDTDNVAWWP